MTAELRDRGSAEFDSRSPAVRQFGSKRGLRLLPLIAATYFMVSGGPYGLEDIIHDEGYRMAIVLLAVTPLFWSLPVALLVGELSAAIPEDGGYYAWVRRALGPFWGFQEAWLSLVASIFDMAIYPTLFVLYLGRFAPAWTAGWHGIAVGAAVIAVCAMWNIAGIKAVGDGSLLMMVAVWLPFGSIVAISFLRPSSHIAIPTATHPDLWNGVLVAIWNYMGWDNASTVAREVENPQRDYPRAMLAALGIIMLDYTLPVLGAMRSGIDPSQWSTGSWVDVGRTLGGPALGVAIVLGGMICGAGMFNSLVLSYSRVPLAMAEDGFLPRIFARLHPTTGAPWFSIVACSACWTACLTLGFERLVEIDVLLYGLALLLEFVALIMLRVREPNLPRPFRVPGGIAGCALAAVGPVVVLAIAGYRGRTEMAGPISALALGAILVIGGVIVYAVAKLRR
jgi:amino acid transporter